MGARIIGIGSAIPPIRLTNYDLEQKVDTSDEWIISRTGISERRIAPEDVPTSSLVTEASKRALARAGIEADQIDALIVGTATPDTLFPSTACWAQPKIGLRSVPVFDVSAACSGFLYGLVIADSLIATRKARYVLLVGAEILSRVV
ncbi:MAG: 3-oxoacyl-ACP synthase, partial [Acidobacteriota bacterium]